MGLISSGRARFIPMLQRQGYPRQGVRMDLLQWLYEQKETLHELMQHGKAGSGQEQ